MKILILNNQINLSRGSGRQVIYLCFYFFKSSGYDFHQHKKNTVDRTNALGYGDIYIYIHIYIFGYVCIHTHINIHIYTQKVVKKRVN